MILSQDRSGLSKPMSQLIIVRKKAYMSNFLKTNL